MNPPDDKVSNKSDDPGLVLMNEVIQQDLVPQLIRQLNKDFQLCGLHSALPEDALPHEVVEELHRNLGELIRDDFQGFLNLLYRADIPESRIHRSEHEGMDDFIRNCSYQLLKREWQKVWLRNKTR